MNKRLSVFMLFVGIGVAVGVSVGLSDPDTASTEEANKETMRWIFEHGVNAHNPDAWDSILTDDYVRHCEAMQPELREIRGKEQMKAFLADVFKTMPDWREEIVHMVAEGNKVALMTKGTGTMTGAFGPMEPTGKTASITNIMIHRFEDGRIAETWITWDNLYFMQQLGLAPAGGAASSGSEN